MPDGDRAAEGERALEEISLVWEMGWVRVLVQGASGASLDLERSTLAPWNILMCMT